MTSQLKEHLQNHIVRVLIKGYMGNISRILVTGIMDS